MAKENDGTMKLPDPFTAAASQRLRKLRIIRNDAVVKKQNATKQRDALRDQIAECSNGETQRIEHLKAACYDEIAAIQDANRVIAATAEKAWETIGQGDDLTLFEDGTLNPNPRVADLFEPSVDAE
jgi:hypothetical protein